MNKIVCSNPSKQFDSYKNEIELAVLSVLRGEQFILGDQVKLLEKEFAKYIGTKKAIGVANGTDALELALRSLNIGIGDEVITVSHTAIATVAAIDSVGAKVKFVDIDPNFFTINPQQVVNKITKKTKALIVVHLYGQSAELSALKAICDKNDIFLIEDVSQAHGGTYRKKKLGSFGKVSCFSCYPTKNLGAFGDAGLITTNDIKLAEKLSMLREYGWKNRVSYFKGRNSRLDEIQAAILRVKLRNLNKDNLKRKKIAKFYFKQLKNSPIILPKVRPSCEHVFHLFVIQTKKRDELYEYLKKNNILAGIHYPLAVHQNPIYKSSTKLKNDLIVTNNIIKNILSLPIYPELEKHDLDKVIYYIKKFFKSDN